MVAAVAVAEAAADVDADNVPRVLQAVNASFAVYNIGSVVAAAAVAAAAHGDIVAADGVAVAIVVIAGIILDAEKAQPNRAPYRKKSVALLRL